jgi:hypothetical protein
MRNRTIEVFHFPGSTRTGGGRKAGEGFPRSKPGGQRNLKQADHRASKITSAPTVSAFIVTELELR